MLRVLYSLLILSILEWIVAMDNLEVAFQWKKLDFHFDSQEARQSAMNSGWYYPYNNVPVGLEVYQDRLFITIPRWRNGVAASLAYIKLSDPTESPKLYPYPNWEAHLPINGKRQIISPFRIRADKCGRLWVMDSGAANILDDNPEKSNPKLLIYDLNTDTLIRSYPIPADQMHASNSFFCNVVVEENNCQDSFAYLADLGHPAMVVYSFESNSSWMVQHHYFNFDPVTGDMTVGGENFQWLDGLFGMALAKRNNGFSTLYFHPMISYHEFTVDTEILRNQALVTNATAIFHQFKVLGSRGAKGQSGSSFYHEKSKVLFYSLLNLNAVACWRTTNPNYTITSQGRIYMNNETMIFPSDLKVDTNDILWVLSDQLPIFMYDPNRLMEDENNYHFRILKSSVNDAIRGTACDSKMVVNPEIVKTIGKGGSGAANLQVPILSFIVICAILFI